MGAVTTRVSSSASLYPPATPAQLRDFLLWVSAGQERNDDGGLVLKRSLTTTERTSLRERAAELLPWTQPSDQTRIKDAISRCFLGFSSTTMSAHEAAVVLTQYTMVMKGLPAWAVERACMRFASGDVRPQEVGAKHLDSNYRPTTAQLRAIAEEFVRPVQEEAHRIALTLKGSPAVRVASDEERARGLESIEAWRAQQGIREAGAKAEVAAARERDRQAALISDERRRQVVLDEYRDAGVEPPKEEPKKALASLPLLLSLGWTIEEKPRHGRVLVKPKDWAPLSRSMGG